MDARIENKIGTISFSYNIKACTTCIKWRFSRMTEMAELVEIAKYRSAIYN